MFIIELEMPRVKCATPKSFKDGCIELVVRNMDSLCTLSTNDLYTIGPEIGSNPFDQLGKLILLILFSSFLSFMKYF